jgi:hypothetical protein
MVNLFSIVGSIATAVGSIFVKRDEISGVVTVNILPYLVICLVVIATGCSFDAEPFSQCTVRTIKGFTDGTATLTK